MLTLFRLSSFLSTRQLAFLYVFSFALPPLVPFYLLHFTKVGFLAYEGVWSEYICQIPSPKELEEFTFQSAKPRDVPFRLPPWGWGGGVETHLPWVSGGPCEEP